jgi:hypothetical protein
MKGLPYVPLDPSWLEESAAFQSENPRVVRALLKLLAYAWNATPAASIPTDFRVIASVTGLTEIEVGDHHASLFAGWTLRDGRLHFDKMFSICERIQSRFADTLQSLAEQAAAVIQSPEDFNLAPQEFVSASKGRRILPKNWGLNPNLRDWLTANDFSTEEDVAFIVQKFITHYRSVGGKMLDWDQAFQNFCLKENRRNLPSNMTRSLVTAGAIPSRMARYGAAGVAAGMHNQDVMAAAHRRREESMRG